jgi:predicted O-methyltransferase YrrM
VTTPPSCLMSPRETEWLTRAARGRVCLELGTWHGETTRALARVADVVWTVDHHRGDAHLGEHVTWHRHLAAVEREGLMDKIITVVGPFDRVLWVLSEGTFGLVLVDGAHDKHSVLHDTDRARNLMTQDGLLCVHDWGRFEVARGAIPILGTPDTVIDSLAVWDGRP